MATSLLNIGRYIFTYMYMRSYFLECIIIKMIINLEHVEESLSCKTRLFRLKQISFRYIKKDW